MLANDNQNNDSEKQNVYKRQKKNETSKTYETSALVQLKGGLDVGT